VTYEMWFVTATSPLAPTGRTPYNRR